MKFKISQKWLLENCKASSLCDFDTTGWCFTDSDEVLGLFHHKTGECKDLFMTTQDVWVDREGNYYIDLIIECLNWYGIPYQIIMSEDEFNKLKEPKPIPDLLKGNEVKLKDYEKPNLVYRRDYLGGKSDCQCEIECKGRCKNK